MRETRGVNRLFGKGRDLARLAGTRLWATCRAEARRRRKPWPQPVRKLGCFGSFTGAFTSKRLR